MNTVHDYQYSFHHINYFHKVDIEEGKIIPYEHNDEWYEIYHLISGDVICFMDDHEFILEPDSILLIPPYTMHRLTTTSAVPFERQVIFFREDVIPIEHQQFLTSTFQHKFNSKAYYYPHISEQNLEGHLQEFKNCSCLPKEFQDIAASVALETILCLLFYHDQIHGTAPKSSHKSKLINQIIQYINDHLFEEISIDMLASRFYITKQYLSSLFRKTTGTTIKEYITYKRVIKGHELIKTGLSASAASYAVGYKDYSTFYRAYKKIFGHSPSNFRGTAQ